MGEHVVPSRSTLARTGDSTHRARRVRIRDDLDPHLVGNPQQHDAEDQEERDGQYALLRAMHRGEGQDGSTITVPIELHVMLQCTPNR